MQGKALSSDDCFSQFDQAFAELSETLVVSEPSPEQQHPGNLVTSDLSEFEEAFSSIDRQLGAYPPSSDAPPASASTPAPPLVPTTAPMSPAIPPGAAPRPSLALVANAAGPAQPTSPVIPATVEKTPRPVASNAPDLEEPWPRSSVSTPLERLAATFHNLQWLQRAILARTTRISERVRWTDIAAMFADARQVCIEFDLSTARVRAEFAVAALEQDQLDRLTTEISELLRHMRHDLQSCSIWPIARARTWAFNTALDERASTAFPSAAGEFTTGARAAGFGLHSACAFHMLRAASAGRDALVAAFNRASTTVSGTDWLSAIELLQAQLTASHAAHRRSNLTAIANDARLLHNAERMLASGSACEENYALAILQTTQTFLQRAAAYLAELPGTDAPGATESLTRLP